MREYNKKKKCYGWCNIDKGQVIFTRYCTANWRHCKFVKESESEFEKRLKSLAKIPDDIIK